MDREATFEIIETMGVIKEEPTGWLRELCLVSWNGGSPRLDIREWSPDHTRMSRGATFKTEEMETLIKLYTEYKNKTPKSVCSDIPADDKVTYRIVDRLGIISPASNGWTKELTYTSWNGRPPKLDIRSWNESHERMTRGITLTEDEMARVIELYNSYSKKR